jgi:hypothetical protein
LVSLRGGIGRGVALLWKNLTAKISKGRKISGKNVENFELALWASIKYIITLFSIVFYVFKQIILII